MVVVLFLIANKSSDRWSFHHQLANHQEVFGAELDSDPGRREQRWFGIITVCL